MDTSEVDAGLQELKDIMRTRRQKAKEYKAWFSALATELTNLATTYNELKNTIDAYTPTGTFETNSQNVLARIISERGIFLADVSSLNTFMASITEF